MRRSSSPFGSRERGGLIRWSCSPAQSNSLCVSNGAVCIFNGGVLDRD